MSDLIHQATVLVLNRNWQAINIRTPAEAFCQMMTDVATALDIDGKEQMYPVKWEHWLQLPIRAEDRAVKTMRGLIRVPTVIVLAKFSKVPMRRPSLSARTIWERDGGMCQYTGRKLTRQEGNIDHIVPRARGGQTRWENCVLADRRVNSRKADKLPEEVGLKLLRRPTAPRAMPVSSYLANTHRIKDWEPFLMAD